MKTVEAEGLLRAPGAWKGQTRAMRACYRAHPGVCPSPASVPCPHLPAPACRPPGSHSHGHSTSPLGWQVGTSNFVCLTRSPGPSPVHKQPFLQPSWPSSCSRQTLQSFLIFSFSDIPPQSVRKTSWPYFKIQAETGHGQWPSVTILRGPTTGSGLDHSLKCFLTDLPPQPTLCRPQLRSLLLTAVSDPGKR